ncbi:GGDEF domain-containing protein [Marinicaulis aureus]|uniref:diguanylate cyclase n=1 Tax=Hyphococcus aureus TaxID=2666033 RepID=A0ABW1KXR9_9PROT
MQAESYFQLLNPLVFLLFSAGFFAVNAVRPSRAVLMLAISYLLGATAFTVDILEQADIFRIGAIAISGVYALTAVLSSAGVACLYRGSAPWKLFGAAFIIHMALYSWSYSTNGYGWTSSFLANFGCGVIFSIGLIYIRNHLSRAIDKVIFWIYFVSCAQCFVRPVLLAYLSGWSFSASGFDQTDFVMALHFVVGACAVTTGMALLVACSTDIIDELQQRSVTDRLSGVYNRRGFEDAAESLLRMQKDNDFVAVILADIDHFKQVNDTRGHAFGDMVIAELGALFNQYADHDRIAGRIGGEEFAMLVIGEPVHVVKDLADALRRDFSKLRIDADHDDAASAFTASFGVALLQPDEGLLSVIARADEALYLSKNHGRNRVSCETDVQVEKLRTAANAHMRRKHRDGLIAAGL